MLRDEAPWIGNVNRMVVRDCYVALADILLDDVTKISLVLGIKGIGNTVFLNYLIVRIIEKYRAAMEPIPDIVYTWKPDEIKRVRFSADGRVSMMSTSSEAPYYLSDSVDIADSSLGTKLLIEVASNDANNYRKFCDRLVEGGKGAFSYYMPAWSFQELLIANPISDTFTMSEAEFLFATFGGCVRYFMPCGREPEVVDDYIQRNAEWFFGHEMKSSYPFVWKWALDAIRQRINKIKVSEATPNAADLVALSSLFLDPYIRDPDTKHLFVGYTSAFMKFLAGCLKEDSEVSLWNTIKGLFGASGEGVAFESLGHKTLVATEEPFTAVDLYNKSNKTFSKSFYQMPRVLFHTVNDIKDLQDDQYGLPLSPYFALVDAVIQPNILLQFTVAGTHGKASDEDKYQDLRAQLRGAKDTHKLIFVLKPGHLKKFGIPADLPCFKMTYMIRPTSSASVKR